MQVSVIIVNYKNPPLILQCVQSILQFEKTVNYEIIVVDNDSQDDTEQQLRAIYPNLKWVQMGYNSGFARANNAGVKVAEGEYMLYLNSDTILIEPIFEKMISQCKLDSKIGVIGCHLLNKDRSEQLSYHDGDLWFQKLWRRTPFAIKFCNATIKNEKDKEQIIQKHTSCHNTRWICGAAIMMKKSIIKQYNLSWCEDFFMYWEDVELCYRVRSHGLKTLFLNEPSIIHLNSGGTDCSITRYAMREQSKLKCMELIHGKFYRLLYTFLNKMEIRFELFLERKNKSENPMLNIEAEFYGI